MTVSQMSGAYGYVYLGNGNYADPVTVTTTGNVAALYAHVGWSIVNAGTVSGGFNGGVDLSDGGFVSNAASGLIQNDHTPAYLSHMYGAGVYISGQQGTVINQGDISGTGTTGRGDGVDLRAGGTVHNTGSITGGAAFGYFAGGGFTESGGVGVYDKGGGAIYNAGHVSAGFSGVELASGGAVTNASGGTISGTVFGIDVQGEAGTVVNDGSIYGGPGSINRGGTAVYLAEGGVVSNAAGGTIASGGSPGTLSGVAIEMGGFPSGSATVINDGAIYGHLAGVSFSGVSNVLANGAGGTISSSYYGVSLNGGTVTNAAGGLITGGTDGVGEGAYRPVGTVTNEGSIVGGLDGVYLTGGLISNGAGGTIISTGAFGGNGSGVETSHYYGTVINAGYISGPTGVVLAGGSPNYQDSVSGTVYNIGTIHGSDEGVGFNAGGLVSNGAGGTITGNSGDGVAFSNRASVENAGSISGGRYGVFLYQNGAVNNMAGATIFGGEAGVKIRSGSVFVEAATLENAGTIGASPGHDAVILESYLSNRLIIDPNAVFEGVVVANFGFSAGNTIELASAAGAGTLMGLGSEYLGFGTVTIDAGATWDVEGLKAAFADTTISGFNGHDALDLTNLTYASGATAVLTGDTLAVTSDGMTIDITMTDTTGMHFYAHDVGGDVLVNEKPACYLRGTQVTTDRGPVAVEELKVGDRLITLSGAAMPIRWIGRRSYAGWAAAGNPGVRPVRFKAGSLADGIPSRDLLVSPEHAMFIDGALIPARHLVNGASIVNAEAMDEIHYFHLELDRHAVIFAEDAASETYVDDDNRGMFHNVYEYYAEHPEATRGLRAEYCAPRVEDGFTLEAVRNALAARAARLRPDGTAAPVAALGGNLDLVSRTLIEGWAFAPETPNEPVALVILDNGAVIGEVMADRYRADLEACGVGDGRHAFRLALPRGLTPEFSHEIEVRRESDWTRLQGSGVVLEPEASALAA